MSDDQNSGEKTEPATSKRLRDARKRGDIPKSKDMTGTLGLAFTMVLIIFAMDHSIEQLVDLTIEAIAHHDLPFETLAQSLTQKAVKTFLLISATILLPIALFGMLIEFLQTGPIFAFDKIQPKLSNLSPAAGIKKMFSMDNFVELMKSLGKTAVLGTIAWFTIAAALQELIKLPANDPMLILIAIKSMCIMLFGWTLGVFLAIMALDAAYQHYAYAKKMRMSISDIKKEHKDNEGDPMLKGQRRQLQQEWSQESANGAARSASVLVVNPTHIAIAIRYDKDEMPVPTITAMAQDENARAMRDAAHEAHVPVLRNQQLARQLLNDVEEGDVVPRELFDVVAEIILWARQTREKLDPHASWKTSSVERNQNGVPKTLPPPGEDLSQYPPELELFATQPPAQHPDNTPS
ncbi:type III secretion system export apparatus subunit SctU [Granulosicoccus antarcticus]|uniref:Yop proteins translocation protein U n=1 Tax=Granulosicoccus antarcticus IMCC3135 TaxID=1192854 RepID=A0A2Z2NGS9_9GAMM|nr:type III secretion system export apparatus subunit SctU [Granulosicoccus antarcticus]ASJ70496.1 Yop proteins translocation protein U [Granulosicoccus antarcticus IMCC3135]